LEASSPSPTRNGEGGPARTGMRKAAGAEAPAQVAATAQGGGHSQRGKGRPGARVAFQPPVGSAQPGYSPPVLITSTRCMPAVFRPEAASRPVRAAGIHLRLVWVNPHARPLR